MKRPSLFRCLGLTSVASTCNSLLSPNPPSIQNSLFGFRINRLSSTNLHYNDFQNNPDDDFSLTTSDLARIKAVRDRTLTIPIVIIESILPGQYLRLASDDVKFQKLLNHVLEEKTQNEIGVIGYNPHTGRPLNMGVTVVISQDNIENVTPTEVSFMSQGHRRFEVQNEPWLDNSESFYLATVEIVEERKEEITEEQLHKAEQIHKQLPALVDKWMELVFVKKEANLHTMRKVLQEIGPMPDNLRKRAMWVASLLNPHPKIDICPEIRPAMLACRNNYERTYLAAVSLKSSTNHLLGNRRL